MSSPDVLREAQADAFFASAKLNIRRFAEDPRLLESANVPPYLRQLAREYQQSGEMPPNERIDALTRLGTSDP